MNKITGHLAKIAQLFGMTLLCFAATPASAGPVITAGQDNILSFTSAQNVIDRGAPGVSVGDVFYGILNITNIQAGGVERWDANNVSGPKPIDSFSGYYLSQITSIYSGFSASSPYAAIISLGALESTYVDPYGKFSSADLAAGAIVKLFVDGTPSATAFEINGSVADDITKATDGTFWGTLGFKGSNNYWSALVLKNGTIYGMGGLDFIMNASGFNLAQISDPSCATCGPVDLYFGTVAQDTGSSAQWRYIGANSATLHPTSIPEPSEVLLLAIGLSGMYWSRRRNI